MVVIQSLLPIPSNLRIHGVPSLRASKISKCLQCTVHVYGSKGNMAFVFFFSCLACCFLKLFLKLFLLVSFLQCGILCLLGWGLKIFFFSWCVEGDSCHLMVRICPRGRALRMVLICGYGFCLWHCQLEMTCFFYLVFPSTVDGNGIKTKGPPLSSFHGGACLLARVSLIF